MTSNQTHQANPIECIGISSEEKNESRMEIDNKTVNMCTTNSTEALKEPQPEGVDFTHEESEDEVIVLEERPQSTAVSTPVITPVPPVTGSQTLADLILEATPNKLQEDTIPKEYEWSPKASEPKTPGAMTLDQNHFIPRSRMRKPLDTSDPGPSTSGSANPRTSSPSESTKPDFGSSVIHDSQAVTATVMNEEMPEESPKKPTTPDPSSHLKDHDYIMAEIVSGNDEHLHPISPGLVIDEVMKASEPLRALENLMPGTREPVTTNEPITSESLPALKKMVGSSRKRTRNERTATQSKRQCLRIPKENEPAPEAHEAKQYSEKESHSEIPAFLERTAPSAKPKAVDSVVCAPRPPRSPKQVTFSTPFWLGRLPYTSTPTGLAHTPFYARPPIKDYPGIFAKFDIVEDKDFPECAAPGVKINRRNDEEDIPKYHDLVRSPGSSLEQLDEKHHATLEDYRGPMADKDYMESEDQEEAIWSHEELESKLRHNEMKLDKMYDFIENDYIFAVWRQFEGQIPIELALQHLRKNQLNVARALDTVDQCLKTLPQKMKDPCIAQIQLFQQEHKKLSDGMDLRHIQEHVMRNFHLPEVHQYFYNFRKFYGVDDDPREKKGPGGLTGTIGCNCNEPMCRELDFEPRYGCSNCTRKLRKSKLQADKLCLICKIYTKTTGKPRPAKNPVFNMDDLEKIKQWDNEECRTMSREDFEKWQQEEKNKKWRALQITKEESLMLNYSRIKLNGKDKLGDQVSSMLQPYKLPHFARCQCSESGGIPNRSKNFGKTTFTPDEIEKFASAIVNTPGDIKSASMALEVEEELVERFLDKYKARDPIWLNLARRLKIHNYEPRIVLPPTDMPPVIPKIGSVQK